MLLRECAMVNLTKVVYCFQLFPFQYFVENIGIYFCIINEISWNDWFYSATGSSWMHICTIMEELKIVGDTSSFLGILPPPLQNLIWIPNVTKQQAEGTENWERLKIVIKVCILCAEKKSFVQNFYFSWKLLNNFDIVIKAGYRPLKICF